MGWMGIQGKMTYAEEKAEVINQLSGEHTKVIGLSKKHNAWYAAVEISKVSNDYVMSDGKFVIGVVIMVSRYKGETMFKVIEEQSGPVDAHAPKKILNMLSDFVSEDTARYGIDWRERCRKNHNIQKFKVGDVIKLENPVTIGGVTADIVTVSTYFTRRQQRVCYKMPNGTLVRLDRYHLDGATLVENENA